MPGVPGGGGVMECNATRPEAAWYELLWHSADGSSQYGGGFRLVITYLGIPTATVGNAVWPDE
jgi:hypothetical protein